MGPQRETSTKRGNDLKGSTNYGLTKERVTQVQSSGTRGSQGPVRVQNQPGNGGGGDSPGGTSGDQRFPGEGRGPPGRNNNQAGGGGDDDPDPSDDGDGDDSSSTDFSAARKRKHKSPKYVCNPGMTKRSRGLTWTSRKRWYRWTEFYPNKRIRGDFKSPQAQFGYHRARKLL